MALLGRANDVPDFFDAVYPGVANANYVLDSFEQCSWALADVCELSDLAFALEMLQDQRHIVERLCELDDLADDVTRLVQDLRDVRRFSDDLDGAIAELEDLEEVHA